MTAKRLFSSKRFRLVVSCFLVLHLLALFLPPLSFQTQGPLGQSPAVASALLPLEAYGQFLYIDRGYAFFAPDPGPSHMIQVAVTNPEGNREEFLYPDRRRQWPRLLYHRHFMLTEFLYDIYQPPLPTGEAELAALDPQELEYWSNGRARYERFRQSMVHHLEAVNPGREVAIRRIEHLIPDLVAFRERPLVLTDEESYRVLLDQPIPVTEPTGLGDTGLGDMESLPEAIPAPTAASAALCAADVREGEALSRDSTAPATSDTGSSGESNASPQSSTTPAPKPLPSPQVVPADDIPQRELQNAGGGDS